MSIIKTNSLPDNILKALKEKGIEGFEIGSVWINDTYHNYYVRKITGIEETKKYGIQILYQEAENWEATAWEKERSKSLEDWKNECGEKLDKPFSEYRAESLKVISGEISIESFEDKSSDNLSSETAIVGKDSKTALNAMQQSLEEKKKRAELVKTFVGYEMEKRKRELEKIKDRLDGVLAVFQKKIVKIMRVITTIELYLGIDEDIFQLQEGVKADANTPISFRQMVLFMDEETAEDESLGKVEWGGLDYSDIGGFDEFLLKNQNYKKLLPEEKGMLVFRPRRNSKDYGEGDPIGSAIKNDNNKYTSYFLIRNGENLYRIFTDKITILDRLFPRKKELQKIFEEVSKLMKSDLHSYDSEKKQDKAEDIMYRYKKQAIFLQGLIDRTEIFHPLPKPEISVFKIEESEKYFNFIYDDEITLPSGRLPFWDWVKKENRRIEHGSRIVLTGNYRSYSYKDSDFLDRLFRYRSEYNAPPLPNAGVYEVSMDYEETTDEIPHYYADELEKKGLMIKRGTDLTKSMLVGYEDYETNKYLPLNKSIKIESHKVKTRNYIKSYKCTFKKEALSILHNPKDEVSGGWGSYEYSERKNRIRWRIYKRDAFVLNYDQISLADIEFYLYNRADRENYLEMMPMLRTLKKWRLVELENEKHFAKMVVGQIFTQHKNITEQEVEKKVWELIEWWKFKNQIKRPIDKDDAKALRMIIKKFNKEK